MFFLVFLLHGKFAGFLDAYTDHFFQAEKGPSSTAILFDIHILISIWKKDGFSGLSGMLWPDVLSPQLAGPPRQLAVLADQTKSTEYKPFPNGWSMFFFFSPTFTSSSFLILLGYG